MSDSDTFDPTAPDSVDAEGRTPDQQTPAPGAPRDRDGIIGDGLLDQRGNPAVHDGDAGTDASGSQSDSAVTDDVVDSGQSEDIENALTGQGVSDRETTVEESRNEQQER